MTSTEIDRNLLFGLLAIQAGLVDRSAISRAIREWSLDKSRGLADVLEDRGDLSAARRSILEGLVTERLRDHGDDPTEALEFVDADKSTVEALGPTGDPEVDATIEALGEERTRLQGDQGDGHRRERARSTPGPGRFRILRPHAKGGLGAVFVALDTELNREVALKQILDRHADDRACRARFLLEAEVTGGLEHPGIVPVYALGSDQDGRPYYAMRFIQGDSLKDAIAGFHRKPDAGGNPGPPVGPKPRPGGSRELELRKLLRRFLDVCNAIEYAHQRGVIHRDLKPSNVMVGKFGETLVVDWGLAKPIGHPKAGPAGAEPVMAPSHANGTIETLSGAAIGTPAYMSPEQAAGDLDRLGPHSDIYSLGATLYCLLTGRPPFQGPDPGLILRAVRNRDFPKPRELNPSIDPALEAVCLKAMNYKPEDRYASAAMLAEDLDLWMADEPVNAFPEPKARKAGRWARRHASLVSGCGVFLAVAALGLGLLAWLVARQNRRLEAARVELKAASGMAHKAVRTLLSDVVRNDLLNIPQGEMLRVKLAERALELYRDFLKIHAEDPQFGLEHARIEEQVASLYRMIGQYDRSSVVYEAAIARLHRLIDLDPGVPLVLDVLAYTEGQFAEMIKLRGGTDAEAEPHFREAVRLAGDLRDRLPDVPRYAHLLAVTAGDHSACLIRAGRLKEAVPLLDRAVEAAIAFRATLPKDPDPGRFTLEWLVLPMAQLNRSSALAKLGRAGDAEASVRPAIATLRALSASFPTSNDITYLLANGLKERADAEATDAARLGESLRDLDEAIGLVSTLIDHFPKMSFYSWFLTSLRADRGSIRLANGQVEPARDDLRFADEKLAERLRQEKPQADLLAQHARVKASEARLVDREGSREKARGLADEAVTLQGKAMDLDPNRPADRTLLDRYLSLKAELAGPGK